jgi:hypothetical protein
MHININLVKSRGVKSFSVYGPSKSAVDIRVAIGARAETKNFQAALLECLSRTDKLLSINAYKVSGPRGSRPHPAKSRRRRRRKRTAEIRKMQRRKVRAPIAPAVYASTVEFDNPWYLRLSPSHKHTPSQTE